jgi:hypothetical protein
MAEGEKLGEEEAEEYESDLDDAPRPVARRRAAASDYEGDGSGGRCSPAPSDFDGHGAAELYDHDDDEAYGTEDEEYEDVYEELGAGGVGRGREAEMVTGEVAVVEDEGEVRGGGGGDDGLGGSEGGGSGGDGRGRGDEERC